MKFGLRTVAAAAVLALSVGCSSGGGFFGKDLPAGDITLSNPDTGAPITTSEAAPYVVPATSLRFSIAIAETRFNGPYTVQIIKQTSIPTALNGGNIYPFTFNLPCFTPTLLADTRSHANVVSFVGSAANGQAYNFPTGVPPTAATGDPCHSGELETANISDGKGHNLLFYYVEQ